MTGELVLAAGAGAAILGLSVLTLYYGLRVRNAESERNEAVRLAARAMEAKEAAEEGFKKAKEFFDERLKLPVVASMTDEQCENLARYLAGKLIGVTRATETLQ